MRNRRRAFEVVDMFEEELAEYTGAPYAVAVDSGTNALFLSLLYRQQTSVSIPRKTYVGVAQAALNAGYVIEWRDEDWHGAYELGPLDIWDAAKRFRRGMYATGSLMCLSFQAGKILPIGRGGAILTDRLEAASWLKRARFDGRTEGGCCDEWERFTTPGHHMYMTPPDAARGLWLLTYLPDDNPDQVDEYPDLSVCFGERTYSS